MEHLLKFDLSGKILIVEDDKSLRYSIKHQLKLLGYQTYEAETAAEAIKKVESIKPDLVILDVKLPDFSGHTVLSRIRLNHSTRLLPVIMVTGITDKQDKIEAIEKGVNDFIVKPFDWKELIVRVNSLIQYKLLIDELEEAELVVVALAKTIDARDSYTAGHSERVAVYAYELGRQIELPDSELTTIHRGSLLHDIGKIAIRDNVLLKRDQLNSEEYEEIKQHTTIGRNLIQNMKTLSKLLPIVYSHHERMDGSGYPEGLVGDDIHLFAQIVAVADVYDALITARPYRPAHPDKNAVEIINKEAAEGLFDKHLISEFVKALEQVG